MLASLREGTSDDPRRLRELLARVRDLASRHRIPSVVIGLAAPEGDLLFPELVRFVQSALRIEDGLFRMTRERAVLFLADATRERAEGIIDRLLEEFREQFPSPQDPTVSVGLFEVAADVDELAVRDVLPALFATDPVALAH